MAHNKDKSLKIYDDLFNAGPPIDTLTRQFYTPNILFFSRNHGTIPDLDQTSFRLHVCGKVGTLLELSLEDLKANFTEHIVAATLQCAGNRRDDMAAFAPIDDQLGWGPEAIGNAEWKGVSLADVLEHAQVDDKAQHVEFLGLDDVIHDGDTFKYGSSIPLTKALDRDVLLAYEMNGKPLPVVHGGPLRVVVPGYIGARSVKWVYQVTVQDVPSENYFQQKAYKLLPSSQGKSTAGPIDYSQGFMLGELSVNSAITTPKRDSVLAPGPVTAQGYAMAGGGRSIIRVDVSIDGGQTWKLATLGETRRWSWRLWEATFELGPGNYQLVVRAWDDAANSQPENINHVWNIKGYMSNAWHRVHFSVE